MYVTLTQHFSKLFLSIYFDHLNEKFTQCLPMYYKIKWTEQQKQPQQQQHLAFIIQNAIQKRKEYKTNRQAALFWRWLFYDVDTQCKNKSKTNSTEILTTTRDPKWRFVEKLSPINVLLHTIDMLFTRRCHNHQSEIQWKQLVAPNSILIFRFFNQSKCLVSYHKLISLFLYSKFTIFQLIWTEAHFRCAFSFWLLSRISALCFF